MQAMVVAPQQYGGPLVWYRDRRRSGQWPGLGPLGHAHDVGQLGDRHDAHDGPVVSCAHRGSGLLHLLAGDCWLSRASGRCWAQRGKRSRYPAQTLCAWRDQQGRVYGHAPRSPGERLTHAVRRRTCQAYFALRISLAGQGGRTSCTCERHAGLLFQRCISGSLRPSTSVSTLDRIGV